MSTTSVADLLAHADLLTRQLRNSDVPITGRQWSSFDTTMHRLMFELIGPGAIHVPARARTALAPTIAVFQSYPEPLRHPVDTQVSAEQAAALSRKPSGHFRRKVHQGNLHAVREAGILLISTRDLDKDPRIAPADFADPHPLARISCALGAAADLVVAERNVEQGRFIDDAQLAGTYVHLLSLAYAAARHSLIHGAVADGDRPLAIAQYAERSIDELRSGASRPITLVHCTSTSPEPMPSTLNERLEAAVAHWSTAIETELVRLVPSADALRTLANQGAHILAVTHQLLTSTAQSLVDAESRKDVSSVLAAGARALQEADRAWEWLTTASRPGHAFVTASRELFDALEAVGRLEPRLAGTWDATRGSRDLNRAAESLAQTMTLTATLPDRLLRSGLVYAPARTLPASTTRLRAQHQKRFITVTASDRPDLQRLWAAAGQRAREVEHALTRLDRQPLENYARFEL